MGQALSARLVARARAVPILKKLPLFQGLLEDELLKVLGMCKATQLAAGETLFEQGDEGDSLYILLAGELEIVVAGKGVVHVMAPGEVVGEIGLVCGSFRRTAGARAREDCVLLHLFADIFHETVKKHPRLGYVIMRNVAHTLAQRLVEKNQSRD